MRSSDKFDAPATPPALTRPSWKVPSLYMIPSNGSMHLRKVRKRSTKRNKRSLRLLLSTVSFPFDLSLLLTVFFSPIMQKLYSAAGPGGALSDPGCFPGAGFLGAGSGFPGGFHSLSAHEEFKGPGR